MQQGNSPCNPNPRAAINAMREKEKSAKRIDDLMESSEACLPSNANSSGSAAVDGIFVKLRSCADPAESRSNEATDLQFNGKRRSDVQVLKGNGSHKVASSSGITLNIQAPLAAENENCANNNAPEEKKRPQASHCLERETSSTGNFAKRKTERIEVKDWACVNFSSVSGKSALRFLRKLGKMCLSIGMELSLEPTLLIQKNSYLSTDMENIFWTVREFFDNPVLKNQAKFLLVILPDTRIYDVKVREMFKHVGLGDAHHCCLPLHDMTLNKKYLEDVANEIKTKVEECNVLSKYYEDMTEDGDSGLDKEESEDDGSDFEEGNTLSDSCNDMSEDEQHTSESEEVDGYEQSDDSKEMGFVQPNSSYDVLVGDGISEIPAGSTMDNEDDSSSDEQTKYLGDFLETKRFLPGGKGFTKRQGVVCGDLQVGGDVKIWGCVCFSRISGGKAYKFFHKLKYACMSIGMVFDSLPSAFLHEISACPTDIENTLWLAHDEAMSSWGRIDLLILILPDIRGSDDKVEEVCKNMGVVYQCCLPKFARTQSKKYLLEAAREIKSKVVGHKTRPLRKAIPFVSEATIIFGADISRCTPGEGSISIASLVASMNWPEVSKYRSVTNCQPHSEVVINGDMVRELLLAFKQNTKKKTSEDNLLQVVLLSVPSFVPGEFVDNIATLHRHGIFESQLNSILSDERGAIKKACASLEDGYEPAITFVVVASQGVGEGGPNPKFFCNHAAGPSMLAHYHVIHDDNCFTVDEIKYICNNLFTPHDRWAYPKMSMVPPTFFACRVASRARSHVEEQISLGRAIDDLPTLHFPKYDIFC